MVPYLREIMEAWTDPDTQTIVVKKSSQVGSTDLALNFVGYHADVDPCPILCVVPTVDAAEVYSKERIKPMIDHSEALSKLIKPVKSRDAENTLLNKKFPGGRLNLVGANSPTGLAMRAIRVCIFDEINKFPVSTGEDGDPMSQGENRQKTYRNRKLTYKGSTPTIKGASRIDVAYEASSQEQYWCPCPDCGHQQVLVWGNGVEEDSGESRAGGIRWFSTKSLEDPEIPENAGDPIQDPRSKTYHYPDTATYECEQCQRQWTEAKRHLAVRGGVWRARRPGRSVRGFHMWEGMSLLSSMAQIVKSFVEAKALPDTLRVWINQVLGESYEVAGVKIEAADLYARNRTDYDPEVIPAPASLIAIGADVQHNRIELETVAVSGEPDHLYETWSMRYDVLYGDPKKRQIWADLDDLLLLEHPHANGAKLRAHVVCIDSGAFTNEVYTFAKRRFGRRVYAIKGRGGAGHPAIINQTNNNEIGCELFTLGVDYLKSLVYSRLGIEAPGPGFCHFPLHYPLEYFGQLTSEVATTKWKQGQPTIEYVLRPGVRNEALDCRTYAMAAVEILRPVWGALMKRTHGKTENPKQEAVWKRRRTRGGKRPGGWVTNW